MSAATLQNLKLKFNLCKEKQKKLYYGVKQTKLYSLDGKLNQIIIYRVIQTLAILDGNNLDFFLIFTNIPLHKFQCQQSMTKSVLSRLIAST